MRQIDLFQTSPRSSRHPDRTPLPFRRERSESWDFRTTQASSEVYGIHPYPAMFHFQVVRRLLLSYSTSGDTVLDPFLGSGVTAVECLVNDRNLIGFDINPLAHLIARVRTTPLSKAELFGALDKIGKEYKRQTPELVDFHNIRYWFEDDIIDKLSRLRKAVLAVQPAAVRDFFRVVFSELVRRASRTSYNEFKLLRQKGEPKPVRVSKTFNEISLRNISSLTEFFRGKHELPGCVRLLNDNILKSDLGENTVDLVITSPPYGDSRTTVAYGQFSRLSLRWLGFEETVDRTSLGSRAKAIERNLPSEVLYDSLAQVADKNTKRAREVFAFYDDLYAAIRVIGHKVKRGKYVCFVVGNRTVQGERLPTDKISADFFESVGFVHDRTHVRAISNKRMPTENSPSNVRGQKDSTMRFEYIVILKKHL